MLFAKISWTWHYITHLTEWRGGRWKDIINYKTSLKTPVLKELSNPRGLLPARGWDGFLHLITTTSCPNAVLLLFFSRVRSLSGAPDKESGCGLFTYFNAGWGGGFREGDKRYICLDIWQNSPTIFCSQRNLLGSVTWKFITVTVTEASVISGLYACNGLCENKSATCSQIQKTDALLIVHKTPRQGQPQAKLLVS